MIANNNIKVSVIVPIYNVEKYLEKCIESIINQSYKNLEIILIDDGSPDNSGVIAEAFARKDNRIKVIHQKNSGVSVARNVGIDASTGEYICFADSDDYLMPDYVEYLLNIAIENDVDISITTEMFDNFTKNQTKDNELEILSPSEATVAILCYRIPIGVYCKLFKKSFLGNEIRFIPELYIGEGFNFNTAAFQQANSIGVGHRKIYYYRRDNPTSATTQFSIDKWENGLTALQIIKKILLSMNPGLITHGNLQTGGLIRMLMMH